MKKKCRVLLQIVLSVLTFSANAGDNNKQEVGNVSNSLVSNQSVSFQLFGFDYTYEQALKNEFALDYAAGLGTNLSDSYYSIVPYLIVEPRCYYNFNKRQAKGKNSNKNSANYIALKGRVVLPSIYSNYNPVSTMDIQFAPVWGFKRVYKENLVLDGYLGWSFGIASNGSQSAFGNKPMAGIKIGYIF